MALPHCRCTDVFDCCRKNLNPQTLNKQKQNLRRERDEATDSLRSRKLACSGLEHEGWELGGGVEFGASGQDFQNSMLLMAFGYINSAIRVVGELAISRCRVGRRV